MSRQQHKSHEATVAYRSRKTQLGPGLTIRRALPVRERRMVGPWCFLDRYGPLSFTGAKPMDVAPHPHIGLQTVSWLLDGEIVHNDSLGSEALLRRGHVGVMTAGYGIAHTEETPRENTGRLNGVQLWTALPERASGVEPEFQHLIEAPEAEVGSARLSVFYGSWAGAEAKAAIFSPGFGAELRLARGESAQLPLRQASEHGLLVLAGRIRLEDQELAPDTLYYLHPGRTSLDLRADEASQMLIIGGEPFAEDVLLWWNFVARTPEEIEAARQQWERRERFGPVPGYQGARLRAPELRGKPIRSTRSNR